MCSPGSDDLPGSPALPAPKAAAEDTRAQALSLARETVHVAMEGLDALAQLPSPGLDARGAMGPALVATNASGLPIRGREQRR